MSDEENENMLSMPKENAVAASKNKQALYNCSWCSKPFKYPSQLKEHIRVHTREKPYPCSYCAKAFSHSSALTQHERIHTGEKPFSCTWCEKSFSQSSNLKRHERVHATSCTHPADARRPRPPVTTKAGRGITEHNGQDIEARPAKKSRSIDQPQQMKTDPMQTDDEVTTPTATSQSHVMQHPQHQHQHQQHQHQHQIQQQQQQQHSQFPMKNEDRYHMSPQSNNTFQRELYPRSPQDSPSRIMRTPRAFGNKYDENCDPTPEIGGDHFVQRCRQAALHSFYGSPTANKSGSMENYLEGGMTSMSPLIQDDVSSFLMTRLAWSPSVLLGERSPLRPGKSPMSPHRNPSVVQSLNMKDENLPSSSLSRNNMGAMEIADSPTKSFIRTNLHNDKEKMGHFRF